MGPPDGRDAQLEWVLRLAATHHVPLWLEAGTLLGIAREGRPLAHDKDLDLALWAQDAPGLQPVAAAATAAGYRVYRETHHGWMHKMKLFPPRSEGRTIDLQVYRRTDTHAWSPVRSVPDYVYRWRTPHVILKGALRWPLRWWWQEHARNVEVTKRPWRNMARLWTWWIPLRLVAQRTDHPATGHPVPIAWQEYLGTRYGDWQTPDPEWDTEHQDPMLRKEAPEAVVGRAAREAPTLPPPPRAAAVTQRG